MFCTLITNKTYLLSNFYLLTYLLVNLKCIIVSQDTLMSHEKLNGNYRAAEVWLPGCRLTPKFVFCTIRKYCTPFILTLSLKISYGSHSSIK